MTSGASAIALAARYAVGLRPVGDPAADVAGGPGAGLDPRRTRRRLGLPAGHRDLVFLAADDLAGVELDAADVALRHPLVIGGDALHVAVIGLQPRRRQRRPVGGLRLPELLEAVAGVADRLDALVLHLGAQLALLDQRLL